MSTPILGSTAATGKVVTGTTTKAADAIACAALGGKAGPFERGNSKEHRASYLEADPKSPDS